MSEGAAQDEHQRFAESFAKTRRLVHGLLLSRLSAQEAEDGVQEVYLQAWQVRHTLRDPSAFTGWIAQIARNQAIDKSRARRRRGVVDSLLAVWDGGLSWMGLGAVSGADQIVGAHRVLEHIQALPEAYRETLVLRLVEELSAPEIAELTGMTPGSVRVNLHRGMALLRERIGGAP